MTSLVCLSLLLFKLLLVLWKRLVMWYNWLLLGLSTHGLVDWVRWVWLLVFLLVLLILYGRFLLLLLRVSRNVTLLRLVLIWLLRFRHVVRGSWHNGCLPEEVAFVLRVLLLLFSILKLLKVLLHLASFLLRVGLNYGGELLLIWGLDLLRMLLQLARVLLSRLWLSWSIHLKHCFESVVWFGKGFDLVGIM